MRTEYVFKRKDIHDNSNLQRYFINAKWRIKILFGYSTFVYGNRYNLPRRHAVLINAEIRLNKYPRVSSSRLSKSARRAVCEPNVAYRRNTHFEIYNAGKSAIKIKGMCYEVSISSRFIFYE